MNKAQAISKAVLSVVDNWENIINEVQLISPRPINTKQDLVRYIRENTEVAHDNSSLPAL